MEKNMTPKQLKEYRVKLFRDAAAFRKPDRIPHFANVVTWKVFDAGYTLDQAFSDFTVMEKCVTHFLDTYKVDALIDVGIRNQFNITNAFSKDQAYYYYDDNAVGVHDHAYCNADTLDEYLENSAKFIWEKALPAKYADWHERDIGVWQGAFDEYIKYMKYIFHISSVTGKQYGLPSNAPNNPMVGKIEFGIEHLMETALGIKQLSIMMRRNPEKIKHFVDTWDEREVRPAINKILAGKDGPNLKYCFDSSIVMLAHNILNPKQFEEYYWPRLEPLLKAYAAKKKNVRIYTEGSIGRYAEYFKDIPKGTLTFHIENDDPFELRKLLPNVAIMGGLSTELLGSGTPDECVAYTRRLFEELGSEGGFILSQGKMLSFRNDAKSENLKAVCDFVSDYYL